MMERRINANGQERFRRDIQGIRGISVLSVVLFHLNETFAPGGFLGVDVFFAVSGFIITELLLREYEAQGTIRLGAFLARRARRLLPNASLLLVFVLGAGLFIIPSYDYPALVDDVTSAALYYSNFHFLAEKLEYFKSNLAPSAVVHFWSLSIEEQFYFLWPASLILIAYFAKRFGVGWRSAVGVSLLILWLCSFASCVVIVQHNQPLAFFGSGTRVWELASGALLAVYRDPVAAAVFRFREWLAIAGLGLIVGSIMFIDARSSHPGALTLVPMLGTLMAIAAGTARTPPTRAMAILSSGGLNWLGDRSYSIYLWHWPLIVFSNRLIENHVAAGVVAVLSIAVLSTFAFSFVERPIHRGRYLQKMAFVQIGIASLSVAAVVAVGGLSRSLSNVVYGREVAKWTEVLRVATNDDGAPYRDKCHLDGPDTVQPDCVYGDKAIARTAIVFGDSHAAHWFPALEKAGSENGWAVRSWSKSICPAAKIRIWDPHRKTRYIECDQWREGVVARMLAMKPRPVVFVSSSNGYDGWTQSADGSSMLVGKAVEDAFEKGLTDTVKALRDGGVTVFIIRDTPLADVKYKECVIKHLGGVACERPRSKALNPNEVEKRVAASTDVGFIDVTDAICDPSKCPVIKNGVIVYRDDSHMTATFARTLSAPIEKALRSLN